MKRLFWFGLGFTAGFAACRKATETARQATPAGLASNLGDAVRELAGAMGAFSADVRAGMSEREQELSEWTEPISGLAPKRSEAAAGVAGRHAHRDEAAAEAGNHRRARRAED